MTLLKHWVSGVGASHKQRVEFPIYSTGANPFPVEVTMRPWYDTTIELTGDAYFYDDLWCDSGQTRTKTIYSDRDNTVIVALVGGLTGSLIITDSLSIKSLGAEQNSLADVYNWSKLPFLNTSYKIYTGGDVGIELDNIYKLRNLKSATAWAEGRRGYMNVSDLPPHIEYFFVSDNYNCMSEAIVDWDNMPKNLRFFAVEAAPVYVGDKSNNSLKDILFCGIVAGELIGNVSSINIADLPTNVGGIMDMWSCYVYGNLKDIPSSIKYFKSYHTNTSFQVTGNFSEIHRELAALILGSPGSWGGNLEDLPPGLNGVSLTFPSTSTGNISGFFSDATSLSLQSIGITLRPGQTFTVDMSQLVNDYYNSLVFNDVALTGNYADLPSSSYVYVRGAAANNISGTIPKLLNKIQYPCLYNSGNLSTLIQDQEAINIDRMSQEIVVNNSTGNVSIDLSKLTNYFTISVKNPANLTILNVNSYKPWRTMYKFEINTSNGTALTSSEVDDILIKLAACTWLGSSGKRVDMTGIHAAPTSNSLAARNTLISNGVTLALNTAVQYVYNDDGITYSRKGVRDGAFVVDKTITPAGFAGVEDTDWTNLQQVQ